MRRDARQDFFVLKRLGDIIHAARLKTLDFIGRVGQRGHKITGISLMVARVFI